MEATMIAATHAVTSACPHCGVVGALVIDWRETDIGDRVIAWPWVVCDPHAGGCGSEFAGKTGGTG